MLFSETLKSWEGPGDKADSTPVKSQILLCRYLLMNYITVPAGLQITQNSSAVSRRPRTLSTLSRLFIEGPWRENLLLTAPSIQRMSPNIHYCTRISDSITIILYISVCHQFYCQHKISLPQINIEFARVFWAVVTIMHLIDTDVCTHQAGTLSFEVPRKYERIRSTA